jgi:hypothetical protein
MAARMKSVQSRFDGYAKKRANTYSSMAAERTGSMNSLKSISTKGPRAQFSEPSSVGGSGYIPKRMATVDDRPKPVIPRLSK